MSLKGVGVSCFGRLLLLFVLGECSSGGRCGGNVGIGTLISIFPPPVFETWLSSGGPYLVEEFGFGVLHSLRGVGVAAGHLDAL